MGRGETGGEYRNGERGLGGRGEVGGEYEEGERRGGEVGSESGCRCEQAGRGLGGREGDVGGVQSRWYGDVERDLSGGSSASSHFRNRSGLLLGHWVQWCGPRRRVGLM